MKIIFLIVVVILLGQGSVEASTFADEFCSSFAEAKSNISTNFPNSSNKDPSIWATLKLAINPRVAVEMNELQFNLDDKTVSDAESSEQSGVKYVFVQVKKVELSKEDENNLKRVQKEWNTIGSELEKKTAKSLFETAKTKSDCKAILSAYPDINALLEKSVAIGSQNQILLEKKKNAAVFQGVSKKTEFLRNRGWRIVESNTFPEAFSLMKKDGVEAIFITHAASDGSLIDTNQQVFPDNFFASVPGNINKVVVFSCYSDKVIYKYAIDKISRSYRYFYPNINDDYNSIFQSSTPVAALKALSGVIDKMPNFNKPKIKLCHLELSNKRNGNRFNLYINNLYIGSSVDVQGHDSKFFFDCSYLQTKTYIDVFPTHPNSLNIVGQFDIIVRSSDESEVYSGSLNNVTSGTKSKSILVSKTSFVVE